LANVPILRPTEVLKNFQRFGWEVARQRGFRLFPAHNKYTTEDWQWLLAEAGFAIRYQTQWRPTHRFFVATGASASPAR